MILNSRWGYKWDRRIVVGSYCLVSLLIALLYSVDFGAVLLDEIDFYVNNIGLLSIGIGTCIGLGWIFQHELVISKVGKTATYMLGFGYPASLVVGLLVGCGIARASYTAGTVIAVCLPIGLVVIVSFLAYRAISPTTSTGEVMESSTKAWWLFLGGIETTRAEMNTLIAPTASWYSFKKLTLLYSLLIKFGCMAFLVLLISATVVMNVTWDHRHPDQGGTPLVYTIICMLFVVILVVGPIPLDAFVPDALEFLCPVHNRVLKVADYPAGYGEDTAEEEKA